MSKLTQVWCIKKCTEWKMHTKSCGMIAWSKSAAALDWYMM